MSQLANQLSTPAIRIDYESLRRSMGDVATRLISLEQVVVAQSQDISLLGQHVQALLARLAKIETVSVLHPQSKPQAEQKHVSAPTPQPEPIRYNDGDYGPDEEVVIRRASRPETIEDVLTRVQ